MFIVCVLTVVACNKNRESLSTEKQRIEENNYIFPENTRFVENYH